MSKLEWQDEELWVQRDTQTSVDIINIRLQHILLLIKLWIYGLSLKSFIIVGCVVIKSLFQCILCSQYVLSWRHGVRIKVWNNWNNHTWPSLEDAAICSGLIINGLFYLKYHYNWLKNIINLSVMHCTFYEFICLVWKKIKDYFVPFICNMDAFSSFRKRSYIF